MFATVGASCERIVAIDDEILCKVKITRWRGAVWRRLPEQWLCAAGWREAGDPDDFYAALAKRGRAWRAEYNASNRPSLTTDAWTKRLLPDELDRKRLALEDADARARAYEEVVPRLVRDAIRSGTEARDEVAGYGLAILVERRDFGAIYIGLRIRGPLTVSDYTVILAEVPGADRDGWFIDRMPHRTDDPGEIVWSNVMDEAFVAEVESEEA